MKHIIRQGDSLKEYGGPVIDGHYLYSDRGIAVKGDAVKCNKHGMATIIEDSPLTKVDGQSVALHGHRCVCGCALVSSDPGCRVTQ